MEWFKSGEIKKEIIEIIRQLNLDYIDPKRIICFKSKGSTSRARARIWSFPRIWQQALNLPSYYIVEVISEKFERLSSDDKKRVLIHELLHIPKTFSGSLVPHRTRYSKIDTKRVETLFKKLC